MNKPFTVRIEGQDESEQPTLAQYGRALATMRDAQEMLLSQFGLQRLAQVAHVTVDLLQDGGAVVNIHGDGPQAMGVYVPPPPSPLKGFDLFLRPSGELAKEGTPERQEADKALHAEHTAVEIEEEFTDLGRAVAELGRLCPAVTVHTDNRLGVGVAVETPCGCSLVTKRQDAVGAFEEAAELAAAHLQRKKKSHLDA